MSFYVYIVSSRENPIYEEFDRIRRIQLTTLAIPHTFLLNGPLPDGYLLADDEEYYSADEGMIPAMFNKFVNATKHSGTTYIVRVNSSTFIDFRKLPAYFAKLPTDHYIGGWPLQYVADQPEYFLSGFMMIMTGDVFDYLVEYRFDSVVQQFHDDVAISMIAQNYCALTMMPKALFAHLWYNSRNYEQITEQTIFFRVKNPDRDTYDRQIWYDLFQATH